MEKKNIIHYSGWYIQWVYDNGVPRRVNPARLLPKKKG